MRPGFDVSLVLLILLMLLITKTFQRKRKPIPPLVHKLNRDTRRSQTPPLEGKLPLNDRDATQPIRRNAKICVRCMKMWRLADEEYRTRNNKTLFCIRLLQIERCVRKSQKDCELIPFLTLLTGVVYKKKLNNCTKMNINATDVVNIIKPSVPRRGHRGQRCRYRQHNKKLSRPMHCGLFGDPHLKTFLDVRQTCIVAGAWTLVDNKYLAVQVTNEIVHVQHTQITGATVTTKISIIFKERRRGCIQQKIYEATSKFLPTIFKDGTSSTGSRCKTHIKKKDEEVIIKSCRSNTTILIRKFGKYLTFNILAPYEIAANSSGLCHTGCPASELVDYHTFLHNRINEVSTSRKNLKKSAKPAMATCADKNLTDFYYDSCVFDLLTTGNTQFREAAHASMIDARNMDPRLRLRRENSAVLSIMQAHTSSSSNRTLSSRTVIFLLILICFILSWIKKS